ncbi:unnamed protein product [Ectocarpus sp. 13 AM-2016]
MALMGPGLLPPPPLGASERFRLNMNELNVARPTRATGRAAATAAAATAAAAASAAAAAAATIPGKEGYIARLEHELQHMAIIVNRRAGEIRRLQNQLGCIEGNFLGQLEFHNERADAAEQRVQVAERRTRVVEARARAVDERMRVAEERAATAEERVSIAEAAMAHLAEEAVGRTAAGPQLMPSIGALATAPQQEVQGSPATPRLADLMRSWQQNKCRDAFVARMRDGFTLQLRAARDALAPGSGMLGAEEELGHGTFGSVFKAVCDATKTTWAIKRPMKARESWRGEMDKEFLIHEMLVYSSLPAHANILGVRAMYDISHSPALALECGECDMLDALFEGRLSFPDELDCLADVVAGTRHCNDNGVVLCDLKFSNVILVHNGARYVAKVSDFGLSCAIGHNRYPRCGTPGYFPHEVSLQHTVAEPSTDTFSVGAMLAILALQPMLREENIFCHQMFLTPEEALQLPQLAQEEFDSYRERQEEIGYRTMLLPNSGFAKKVTRPVVVNTMPGTQLTNIRKLVRTTTSSNPAHRPTMVEIAPQILAVASAVRLAMQQNVTPVASAATLPSGDVDEVQPSAHASTGRAVAVEAGPVDAAGLLGVDASADVPLAPIFHGDALLAGGGGGGSSGRGDGGGGGASAAGAPAVGSGVEDRLGGGDSTGGGRSAASAAVPRHMSAEVQEAVGAAEGRGAEGISGGGGGGGSEASGRAGERAGGDAVRGERAGMGLERQDGRYGAIDHPPTGRRNSSSPHGHLEGLLQGATGDGFGVRALSRSAPAEAVAVEQVVGTADISVSDTPSPAGVAAGGGATGPVGSNIGPTPARSILAAAPVPESGDGAGFSALSSVESFGNEEGVAGDGSGDGAGSGLADARMASIPEAEEDEGDGDGWEWGWELDGDDGDCSAAVGFGA